MPVQDYGDPAIFGECVSAITLKNEPRGYLADCLSEYDVDVTVVLAPGRGLSKARPWLYVDGLDECRWAHRIKAGHLLSDHLEGSAGIYNLSEIEALTIGIRGRNFSDDDVLVFQNAIGDLSKLQRLCLIVAAEALEEANDYFRWPHSKFTVEILVDKPARKPKKPRGRLSPDS